ncbi:hypothetical protein [Methanocella conradii]|nr:hypothetical protein [Methanocella conradii]MDI6897035.1 hypothetical protein [Methanocella conradii]
MAQLPPWHVLRRSFHPSLDLERDLAGECLTKVFWDLPKVYKIPTLFI